MQFLLESCADYPMEITLPCGDFPGISLSFPPGISFSFPLVSREISLLNLLEISLVLVVFGIS